jgi:hypothetical protein
VNLGLWLGLIRYLAQIVAKSSAWSAGATGGGQVLVLGALDQNPRNLARPKDACTMAAALPLVSATL